MTDRQFDRQTNFLSIKKLFKTYHSFSKISGIELNTAKTEILRIGDEHIEKNYIIVDVDGNDVISKSIEAIKVCGITYSGYSGFCPLYLR